MNRSVKSFFIYIFLLIVTIQAYGKSFVYFSLRRSNAVKIFELNKSNGSLLLVDSLSVNGGPAAMALHPSKKYLYVAQREAKTISTFSIDKKSGKLTCLSTIKAIENPVYLSCDKTGKYLFTAYYAAGKIGVQRLDRNGLIEPAAMQVESGFKTPHCILIDNSNKYVFVTDKDGDKIFQYCFDKDSGKLTPNNPFEINTPANAGPRHLIFNKKGTLAYFVNENGNTATLYSLALDKGLLTIRQTVKTLPDSFKQTNKTADIHLTPDNKFLYITNRGHNSVAAYSVNKKNGVLNLIGIYPTENNPRSFAIDQSGNYLIVAGESSDWISIHRINKSTGELKRLYSQPVGKQPSWVTIIEN